MKVTLMAMFWGAYYRDLFLEVNLRCLLDPGNLAAFERENSGANRFTIYTTQEDAQVVRATAQFAKLSAIMPVRFVFVEEIGALGGPGNKYNVMTRCHCHAINAAAAEDSYLVLLSSDGVFPAGILPRILVEARAGKTLIMNGVVRINSETFFPQCYRNHEVREESLSIAVRDLVRLSLDNLYHDSRAFFWDSPNYLKQSCTLIFFQVPGEGVLLRGLHLHPLMFKPPVEVPLDPEQTITIDAYGYLAKAFPDLDRIHVYTDSDQMFFVDISNAQMNTWETPPANSLNVFDMALHAFGSQVVDRNHLYNLSKKIRMHHCNPSPAAWDEAETLSDLLVDQLFATLKAMCAHPGLRETLLRARQQQSADGLSAECVALHNRQGDQQLKLGRLSEAQAEFQRSVQIDPSNATAHLELSRISWQLGLAPDTVLTHLSHSLNAAPLDREVQDNAQDLLTRLGRPELATQLAQLHQEQLRQLGLA